MKHILKHIILLVALIATQQSVATNDLQLTAEKSYSKKNYKAAIDSYEQIIKEGYASYKLYYNLGNAYYKNNQIGKAIYNYELANKLEPNNEDIKTNLRIANEKTIDDIESKENFFLVAIKSGLVNLLSTTGWAWLSIVSCVLCLALIFLFFASQSINIKRLSFFSGLVFLIVFISSMVLGFSALRAKHHVKFAIITARESRIKEEPSNEASSKFSLHEGTRVKVLETNSEWTNIKLENGNEGWIKTTDVGLF